MTKQEWRTFMKKKLAHMPSDTFGNLCKKIQDRLFQDCLWHEANTIGLTVSVNREIDTKKIIEEAWKLGKQTAVPKCSPDSFEMEFYLFDSFSQIERGFCNLEEPVVEKTRAIAEKDLDLLIVPGLAFDKNGYRIGYGGGFFDRYLQKYPNETISLSFECQLIPHVPRDRYDKPVNQLITEKACYKTRL
ncbi:5-formyltetrahydrofolate cyclo-ligase [Pueribacillus theae]|uniref:5-formyltetrahydrofolate cyclo-ligase n=1 Tax=Pueribacillus theae TaxID=2171751 RepID=A0A2U1K7S8_9BACI|nr:5-formyltetrahydrofolate cyclo-ligase [Pueribacillus theae]PWA13325.1 5-formyltetrahydrofolate cyclo-ligase [Pueribacillus theae]